MAVRAGDRDALGTAVLTSILLHVLLLTALPGWRSWSQVPLPVPIVARILPEPQRPERAIEPTPPRAAPSAPALIKPRQAKRAAPPREESSERAALATSASAGGEVAGPSAPAAEPSAAVAVASVTAPLADPGAAPSTTASADAGTIARYRLAIISLAKGFNRYPRVAIENDWQGRAEVRLSIGSDGGIASLALHQGSGYEILDRHALDMIGRAAPQVPLPAALRGREFTLAIPVIFSLQER